MLSAMERRHIAQLRVGIGSRCHRCGEADPWALIAGRDPMICAECDRIDRGKSVYDKHHLFGRANSAFTIRVNVKHHRAFFSVRQYDRHPDILRNPRRDPIVKATAIALGLLDLLAYLLEYFPEIGIPLFVLLIVLFSEFLKLFSGGSNDDSQIQTERSEGTFLE
jgi:hypothetical protein